MNGLLDQFEHAWTAALRIWSAGGWCMLPIAITGLCMFALGTHVWLRLRETGHRSVSEATWRRWLEDRRARTGPIGELLDQVADQRSLPGLTQAFLEVRTNRLAPFVRDLRVMKVCIGAAPLLGLLGTVTGMLATFNALATGSGGDQTMAMVSRGISEALITTETGLVVALPGVFFQYQLGRAFERYRIFLAHLETVCTQNLLKRRSRQPHGVGRNLAASTR
ncbi:MAG: MotA/TolQ/ExbB proton channel family protein [Planctomycetes bacterium]|nr:MotA/TolQ/ExbB proton channel family protein [Planctomycetota bacterium]